MNMESRGVGLKATFTILDWLRYDVIAALSVWAPLVPQGLAYSSIAVRGSPAVLGERVPTVAVVCTPGGKGMRTRWFAGSG